MKQLKISDDLSLPIDFVTERIAFLARTGAGKSGGMRVLFEGFLETGQFAIFVDPKGDAWGVRAAGVGDGYPVLVMGGDHGDVPLESTAGKVIAEFLVKERVSTVLDVSDFGKAEMVRFVTDLASTLYRRNRDVVHVFFDEADMVAGEKFYDPRCLEAIQLIQNKGRHRGFGVTIATQRSAMINKTVLYASGTLVAMQTTAPKDIATVRDWLEVVATKEIAKEIVSVLPTLRTREALIYSPQYLGIDAVRIEFKHFRTFDSMRTPKPGEARQQPKSLADIDLSAIQRDMAATIEKAKQEDPKELRRQIAEMKKSKGAVDPEAIEKAEAKGRAQAQDEFLKVQRENEKAISDLRGRLDKIASLAHLNGNAPALTEYKPIKPRVVADRPTPPPRLARDRSVEVSGDLPAGEQRVLSALIQYPDGLTRGTLGALTGYTKRSTRNTYIQRLAQKGFVSANGELITATDDGIAALPDAEPLPVGEELQSYWLARLPEGERIILNFLIESYPNTVDREAISDATGYDKRSTRNTYLQRLAQKQLVTGNNEVKASDNLFLE